MTKKNKNNGGPNLKTTLKKQEKDCSLIFFFLNFDPLVLNLF